MSMLGPVFFGRAGSNAMRLWSFHLCKGADTTWVLGFRYYGAWHSLHRPRPFPAIHDFQTGKRCARCKSKGQDRVVRPLQCWHFSADVPARMAGGVRLENAVFNLDLVELLCSGHIKFKRHGVSAWRCKGLLHHLQ